MKTRGLRSRAPLAWTVAVLLVLAGCGGDGGDADAVDPGVPPDTADVQATDATDDDAGDAADPGRDTPPADAADVPPTGCVPACTGRQYCDTAARECRDLACRACWHDRDCATGEACVHHQFADGARASVCAAACQNEGECAAGWHCDTVGKRCAPAVPCLPGTCGEGLLGDPCESDGVNVGCTPCDEGLSCSGSVPSADFPCEWDDDCLSWGIAWQANPKCVGGRCGTSFCTRACGAGCPEGFEATQMFLKCWCTPVGTSPAGGPCPIFNVHRDAESCGAHLTCLGIEAVAETDPCATDADCPILDYMGNPQCVDGFCGTSFCAPGCDADDDCDPGFMPIDVGEDCLCAPVVTGDAAAGEPCPFDTVHADADECRPGLTCLGIPAADDNTVCTPETVVDDCDLGGFFPNPDCVEGHCGLSFCSPRCDDAGSCEPGFYPIDVSGRCYCAPREVGDSGAGEACPAGPVHVEASACTAELTCLSLPPEGRCEQDDDCVLFGVPQCVDGNCGGSFCSPPCDGQGACGAGWEPMDVGGGTCFCVPMPAPGTSVLGDACPYGNVNVDASACAADLACFGIVAADWSQECAADADCLANGKQGTRCVLERCGYSFCAADCDAAGACPEGGKVFLPGNPDLASATCRCAEAFPAGTSVMGEACPYANVNVAAPACAEGLACVGWAAVPYHQKACTTEGDCADFPGVADCVGGWCGASFCAAPCTGDACAGGQPKLDTGGVGCWCGREA